MVASAVTTPMGIIRIMGVQGTRGEGDGLWETVWILAPGPGNSENLEIF